MTTQDFPESAVDTDLTVVTGVIFISLTFVERHYQSLVPNIGEDPRANDDVRVFI